MIEVTGEKNKKVFGLGRDFKSEFISMVYEFMHVFQVPEKYEVETEIKDTDFLNKNLSKQFYLFDSLISRWFFDSQTSF